MKRVCLVGDLNDLLMVYVGWLARQSGLEVLELDEEGLGSDWAFEFDDARPAQGRLRIRDVTRTASELSGFFVRFSPEISPPQEFRADAPAGNFFLSQRRTGLQHWLNRLPCPVANRPCAGRANATKPHQMQLLATAGFRVPRWITSNQADAVTEFTAGCRYGAIYKSCSGLRPHVRMVDAALIDRLRAGSSPVVAQEYVPGREVRVHSVAERCFATEVFSDGVDYRFVEEGACYQATELPPHIRNLCTRHATMSGLIVAGFDFRVSNEDEWHCLEMNPMPSFLPYELATGQPIATAVLEALTPDARASAGATGGRV
jgi:glutathione synthase/RimK-type ligase-like ATP-grasp enzyme